MITQSKKISLTVLLMVACIIVRAGYLYLDSEGKTTQIANFMNRCYVSLVMYGSLFYGNPAGEDIVFADDVKMASGKTFTGSVIGNLTGNADTVTNGVYTSRTINGLPLSSDIVINNSAGGFASKYIFCDDTIIAGSPPWHELETNADDGVVGAHHTTSLNSYVEMDRYTTSELGLTALPGGTWEFDLYAKTSSSGSPGQLKAELYRLASDGTQKGTMLASIATAIFANTIYSVQEASIFYAGTASWDATDRVGVIIYGQRTANPSATISFIHDKASGYASTLDCPVLTTHNGLNGLNQGNYIHLTATEKSNTDSAISLKHAAVTVSAPIAISTQAISLVNNAVSPATVTAIDIGALANTDTVVPTSKAVTTKLGNYLPLAGGTMVGELVGTTFDTTTASGAYQLNNVNVLWLGAGAYSTNLIGGNGGASMTHGIGTSGYYNTLFGIDAGLAITSSASTTAIGKGALSSLTSAVENTAVGARALGSVTTQYENTALGSSAGYGHTPNGDPATPQQGTFIGASTQSASDATTNETVIGYGAVGNGSNTVTIGNSDVGSLGGVFTPGGMNFGGYGRFKGWAGGGTGAAAIIGYSGGCAYVIGYNPDNSYYYPVILQGGSGSASSSSYLYVNNIGVGIGTSSLSTQLTTTGTITAGEAIRAKGGTFTGASGMALNLSSDGSHGYIGQSDLAGSTGNIYIDGYCIVITSGLTGGLYMRGFYVGDTANYITVNSSGVMYKQSSSQRYKENIKSLNIDSSKLLQLDTKSFNFKQQKNTNQIGLIAEEVADILPEIVTYEKKCDVMGEHEKKDKDGKIVINKFGKPIMEPNDTSDELVPDNVRWNAITALLIEENKRQQKLIDDLTVRIEKLEKEKVK